ncbi:MAG: imidazole glycerol phosphate synthase subunit HisH [Armatimonadetes bacterium]|nr:imidazole glycerol phosphate synthase subunit HisH [Armatimonadota bacterium]
MIGLIDYGAGNLPSVRNALLHLGEEVLVSGDPKDLENLDGLILPGVGHFASIATALDKNGLREFILRQDRPLLGICLGMQVFFDGSEEAPRAQGLGLIPSTVKLLQGEIRIPHLGWNSMELRQQNFPPLGAEISPGDLVYFAHSYAAPITEFTTATTTHGTTFTSMIQKGNLYGTQFHPEKSGEVGLNILRKFVEITRC